MQVESCEVQVHEWGGGLLLAIYIVHCVFVVGVKQGFRETSEEGSWIFFSCNSLCGPWIMTNAPCCAGDPFFGSSTCHLLALHDAESCY